MTTSQTKKIGKYEILDVLGKGGMGVVYKAIDPSIGRLVAIKMITSNFADDPGFLKRFYREAQSTGKLQHPNIVIVHDLGEHEGNPFLVMEFLEGVSLDTIIREERPLPLIEKLNLIIQGCNGLQYAHERNVVHRDIKPGNLMVLNQSNTVKIVDFGIARIEDDGNVTLPSQVIGTIQYMSPEQINGKPVDGRSDVFSMAVVLYQLLTFKLPFSGKDTGSTLLKIINEPSSPLSKYLQTYPPELDLILQRGLAKSREDRYQTAEEFASDLTQVQEQLRRAAVSEYLLVAEDLLARGELSKAREQCLQILRVDRQNNRGKELLQEVQQRVKKQQRGEQAQQLLANAQEASAAQEFDRALLYLEQAIELDSENQELRSLRESVTEARTRAEQRRNAMKRAQSAQYAGDLTEALSAVEQAIALDSSDSEARLLCAEIKLEIEQRKRQMEIQGLVEDAQRQISSRQFTAALEALKKAQTLDPAAPVITELVSLAATGQEQERRRKTLDRLTAGIQEALNQDAFQMASERCDEALKLLPDERSLLKLKSIADRQRQAAEKRQFIEEQISGARKLLDNKQTETALHNLEAACARYPSEASLLSVLTIIQQTLQQEKAEARKNECIQRSKEALRGKRFDEAIGLLETGFAELNSPELEDLLQFAKEEKTSFERRQQVDAAMEEAQRLMASAEYEQAISFLRGVLKENADEELEIILADAERHVDEFNRRVGEAVETAERLLRVDRPAEAVRFLESQPEIFASSPRFREVTGRAHDCQERLQNILATAERAKIIIGCRDWAAAQEAVDECRRVYGDHPELSRVASQIESGRRESATAAVNKATADSRMLLMGRSYDSALELLDSVGPVLEFVAEDLRLRHTALHEEAERGVARRQQEAERGRGNTGGIAPVADDTQERTVWKAPGSGGNATQPETLRERDLDEMQKLANDLETIVGIDELQAVSARARVIATRHGDDQKFKSFATNVSKAVTTRIDSLTSMRPSGDESATEFGYEVSLFRPAAPVAPLAELPAVSEEAPVSSSPAEMPEAVVEEPRVAEPVAPPAALPDVAVIEEAPVSSSPVEMADAVVEEPRVADAVPPPAALPDAALLEETPVSFSPVKMLKAVVKEPRAADSVATPAKLPAGNKVLPVSAPPPKMPKAGADKPRAADSIATPAKLPDATGIKDLKISSQTPKAGGKKPPATDPRAASAKLPAVIKESPVSSPYKPPRTTSSIPAAGTALIKPNRIILIALGAIAAVVLALVIWKTRPSAPARGGNLADGVATVNVRVNSEPDGANIQVHDQACVTPECSVPLAPGDYELRASVAGYAPVSRVVHVDSATDAPTVDIVFSPLPSSIHINTNFSRGEATLDGKPAGKLREGQLNLAEIPAGPHTIKISSKEERAEVGFRALTANAPEISGPLSAQSVSALVVASRAGQVRLLCNCDDGTPVALDSHSLAPIVSGRQDLGAISEGSHQIQIGAGENAHTHIVNVTGQPALDIFLDAERNVGVLVIQTGVDKATVLLDGRKSGQTGSDGIYRTTLPLKSVSVAVSKSGYSAPPAQIANVIKNGETGVSFDLRPVAQKAMLFVAGGQPNAAVSLDGQTLGSLDGAGKYSAEVSPGNHTVEITKAGFQAKKLNMSFAAGNTARLDADMKQIPPPPPPKQEQPKVEVKPPVVQPPPPAAIPSDQQDWQRVHNDKDLEAFVARHPDSPMANVARERLRQSQSSSDRSGVLSALGRYSDAYQHKSTDELEAVWPSLLKQDRKKISDSFKSAVAIQMKLRPVGEPSVSGDSAVVTCERDLIYTFQGGVQKTFSGQVTIRLQKKSGTWLIEGTS
jgi:eukaryotic-like serine/threonine-protein kinase